MRFLVACLILACLLLGRPVAAQVECGPVSLSGDVRLTVESRADNVLLAEASVMLPVAASVYLEYGNERAGWLRTPTTAVDVAHREALVRLRPDTTYTVRAFAIDAAGCPFAAAATRFTTDELPDDLRPLTIVANGRPSYPLTMADLRSLDGGPRWLVALDADWQPVWYYALSREALDLESGDGVNSFIRLSNGNLLFLAREWGLEELNPKTAQPVRRFRAPESRIHHDLLELPDGRVLYLGTETRTVLDAAGRGRPLLLRGDTLSILDLNLAAETRVWSAFDFLDPLIRPETWRGREEDDVEEWTHGNSIALGPRGNVLLSLRHLDQVVSIASDFGSVEWKLGGPDSSFTFPDPTDRFSGQHAAVELANGNLLLFDNGNYRADGEYSRALELQLDFSAMTARKVWEYRRQPDLYTSALSNAVRLPSGNTLVNFGYPEDPDDPITLVEARPDGSAAWEMTLRLRGRRATRYRAYPFTTLAGEQAVEPTPLAGWWDYAGPSPRPEE